MICPFAGQELLPESSTQPHITPRVVILHSVSGYGDPYKFFRDSSNLESHFWVGSDGRIEQFMDTNTKADANFHANGFAVSIETESSVAATEPWTPSQIASIEKLVDWLCTVHSIPRVLCPTWDGAGIGWHIQFGSPGQWTPVSKSCPGPARIEQVKNVIIPAVAAIGAGGTPAQPGTDQGELTVAQINDLMTALDMIHKDVIQHTDEIKAGVLTEIAEARKDFADLKAEVAALKASK